MPNDFKKPNTPTKHFMDIVDIFRHSFGGAHTMSMIWISKGKISKPDAINELTGSKNEPQSEEDFQKLQIEILKLFKDAMATLLKIETEPNPPLSTSLSPAAIFHR